MNNTMQKVGGYAALIEALAYIIGLVVMMFFLNPDNSENLSSVEKLRFILDHKLLYQAWIIIIYVVFGVALIFLILALQKLFEQSTLIIVQAAPLFGYIWSGLVIASAMIENVGLDTVATVFLTSPEQAAQMWKTIDVVHRGLGGGVEVVGGIWVLLISWAGLKVQILSKPVNILGVIVGCAGIITIIPPLAQAGAVFGLLQIVWFIWIGLILLQSRNNTKIG